MGFFDRFRGRRQPTPEQAERLSRITNPQQRAAILKAIAEGETIPDYAWHPIPAELGVVGLVGRFEQALATGALSLTQSADLGRWCPA